MNPVSSTSPVKFSPVKFSSRIKFVTRDKFEDQLWERGPDAMAARGEYAHHPWEIESRVKLKPQGYTDSIYYCSAVGVTDGNLLSLSHLHPGRTLSSQAQKTKEGLRSDIAELSGRKPLQALITGGRAYPDPHESESRSLFQLLVSTLECAGVHRVSTFWGRKSKQDDGPIQQLYDAKTDTWLIHAESRGRDVLTRKDIDRTFEIVEIDPGDTLELSS